MSENRNLSREEAARIEIGHTAISRRLAWVTAGLFVATLFSIPILQHAYEIHLYAHKERPTPRPQAYDIYDSLPRFADNLASAGGPVSRIHSANNALLADINRYEKSLEEESLFGKLIRPPVQAVLTGLLGAGNEKAYIGRDGWLFYRPEIDYLTGPGFLDPRTLAKRAESGVQSDPRKAILDFHRQLQARGITLVLLPTPCKPMIEPEKFAGRYAGDGQALQNPSYADFIRKMRDAGVLVCDVTSALLDEKARSGQAQFLQTDTHWTPQAMDLAAAKLKEFIDAHVALPAGKSLGLKCRDEEVSNLGDIAVMLKLPANQRVFQPQKVRIQQVLTARDELLRTDRSADVLLLGDSFSNIYSLEPMGWGDSAGLAEHLSYRMQRPVDAILRNDAAAHATREELSRELARGKDRLAGKKLVIWQFAIRELSEGDWKLTPLQLGQPPAGQNQFFVPPAGQQVTVTATVEAVSPVPKPGAVPYKDHILTLHLTGLQADDNRLPAGHAVVYAWSMKDNSWTPAAHLRPGAAITIKLKPYADVSAKYNGINRSELDNDDLALQEPCWGELP